VRAGAELDVLARPGMPALGEGPCLANWGSLVDGLRHRPRGYGWSGGHLSRITTSHPATDTVPVQAEIPVSSLLRASAPPIGVDVWPPLHSAWLCPEIPFSFDLGLVPAFEAGSPAPQPI
jgi:hypothetical protein